MAGKAARAALIVLAAVHLAAAAPVRRVVILKVDGLGQQVLERHLAARNPDTGKSRLPWIDYVFAQHGTRMANFYVRGISLSAPSWSVLDSGYPPVIRGNAEFNRATMRVYDYLNFFPFYFLNARSARADMPAVEVLDEAGIPLFIDSFNPAERMQGMQLFQRGVRWETLKSILPRQFKASPKQLFDEWQVGFELTGALSQQQEHELIAALSRERVLYLDLFIGDYDHLAHLTNDEASIARVLSKLDRLVGRVWEAIQQSPLSSETALLLVSDHGMNTDSAAYSQGYSLIDLFGSAQGGAHHVLTNRHPESEYKLRGLDPFVSKVITPSRESFYLRDQAAGYPTAIMDLDGNERASIYLRNSDINAMHILLAQPRASVAAAVMTIIDRNRSRWERTAAELDEELPALARAIGRNRAALPRPPKRLKAGQREDGQGIAWVRRRAFIDRWERQYLAYKEYRRWLGRVLGATASRIASGKLRTEALIPKELPLDRNSVYQLQNYAVNGAAVPGRFERLNYFDLLAGIKVRNRVQPGVSSKPIDFIAVAMPLSALAGVLSDDELPDTDAVWLYGSRERQALILPRHASASLRYVPVRNLRQDANGRIEFERSEFVPGLPLAYFEDPLLAVQHDRAAWLGAWHSESEWLKAIHRTRYSNAIIGLAQQFAPIELGNTSALWNGAKDEAPLLRRFAARLRRDVAPDLLVLASDHWNFNVRSFNPGGNHGSFFRISTHSVLMLAGAGIPRGLTIETPYDALSLVPTLAALTGRGAPPSSYPGPVIEELLAPGAAVLSSPERKEPSHGPQDRRRLSAGTPQSF